MKYQINPIIVDAVQWDATNISLTQISILAKDNPNQIKYTNDLQTLMLVTNAGTVIVSHGDCIVKGFTPDLFIIPKAVFSYLFKKAE